MASFYQRKTSPFYWLRIRQADGRWKDVSSGIRIDSAGSLRKIHQRVSDETAKESVLANEGSSALLRNWVPQWIGHHYENKRSADRAMNAWAHLSSFCKIKGVIHPSEVTYGFCHEYMKWRSDPEICARDKRKAGNWNTALTELRILGTIMQESLSRGWIIANPCSRLRLGRRAVKEKKAIEPEEQQIIEKALLSAPEWMQDSWLVGIKQGCRLSEIKTPMNMINTSPNAMVITFRVKGGKLHPAPLHPALLPLVERRRAEGREFLVDLPQNASRDWNLWFTEQGFPDISFHCLRVTVITRFALANVTAEKAMQYVGHCTEMCHAIYRKLRPRDVASLSDHL